MTKTGLGALPDTRAKLGALQLITAVIVLDQFFKQVMIDQGSAGGLPIAVTPFFNLVLGFNRGVTFGLLASDNPYAPYLLGGLAIIFSIGFWIMLIRSPRTHERLGLAAVAGGALANAIDRLYRGAVTDFLDFHAAGWHWPAFNLADVAIVCGVALLLASAWRNAPAGPTTDRGV
ncbi:MAG: signal peptidase II [Alphaproteobacteria bacterium]|jgi:signal peptidase II|nr:signal peptidase II [Alphaproteobacteria bacterium]